MLLRRSTQRVLKSTNKPFAFIKHVSIPSSSYRCDRALTKVAVREAKDLPPKTLEVLKSSFNIIPVDVDMKKYNSDWQNKHAQSPTHLQSAYYVRYLLDDTTKSTVESDLQKLLDSPSIELEDASTGLNYLELLKSEQKTKDGYRQAAAKKWPEASVFQ